MRRVWLIGMALCASACSVLPGSAPAATPTTAAPTATPAAAATPTRPAPVASPSAVPKPTNTAAPSASTTKVYVGNTDGEGVYLRKTPSMADKLDAYADGTELTVVGDDVSNEGQTWKHVKTPDGLEGYVPAMYTTDAP